MLDDDEPVILPLEDSIDLHSFHPRDIPSVVESYLEAAQEAGFTEVRVIHGRGKGVQKERVRQVLSGSALVESFEEGTPDRGGWGATVVRLKLKGEATGGSSRPEWAGGNRRGGGAPRL